MRTTPINCLHCFGSTSRLLTNKLDTSNCSFGACARNWQDTVSTALLHKIRTSIPTLNILRTFVEGSPARLSLD